MSQTTKTQNNNMRRQLLATVSALALTAAFYGADEVQAADNPTLWIEIGSQFEGIAGNPEPFAPLFAAKIPAPLKSPVSLQNAQLPFSFGEDGKISFRPSGTDLVFSASVRFGRSIRHKSSHQQTAPGTPIGYYKKEGYPTQFNPATPLAANFQETKLNDIETHAIVDFEAGKDIGIGAFGKEGSSTLNFGVRFAQINSKSDASIKGIPDFHFNTIHRTHITPGYPSRKREAFFQYWHEYQGAAQAVRNFHGVGPTISWDASATVMGSTDEGAVSLDWGANAGVLFGRQKASGAHHTSSNSFVIFKGTPGYVHATVAHNRVKAVAAPNLGGFAGLSFRYPNAKLSLGYRADFFFGAMDGGIDAARKENVGFYGPFATISVGIGG